MNGILVINKDIGYTSRDVINIISKCLDTKKVGHTGTLDPMANGVLVVCVNQGLKMCELLTNHDKEYIAGVTLGIETDTLDMEGKILRKEDIKLDKEKILKVVKSFKKTYLQEVPKYSAVKVNGRKLYEYARKNLEVDFFGGEPLMNWDNVKDIVAYARSIEKEKNKACIGKKTNF